MKTPLKLLLACGMAGAVSCAGARQQSCTFSPRAAAGTYSATVQRPNGAREGTLVLRGTGDSLSGSLEVDGLPPLRLVRVRADSNQLTASAVGAGAEATLSLTFTGSEYTGALRAGDQVIPMAGRLLPPCGSSVGPAAARIDVAALIDMLSDSIPSWLRQHEGGGGGLAVSIVDSCAARWTGTFGTATNSRPVTDSTYFSIGSISKTVAAWAVMTLVEEGRIDLDAPVHTYLKRWQLPASQHDLRQVTMRRLLSHTAGTNVPSVLGISLPVRRPTLLEVLKGDVKGFENQKVEVIDAPGTRYRYSGGGYEILQLVVEDITGERFADFVAGRVLLPLGMRASSFDWSERVAALVATPFKENGIDTFPHLVYPAAAAAGLYATIGDMTKFVLAHCAGAERRAGGGVISPSALTRMMRPDPTAEQYGLGYEMVAINGVALPGHSGSNPGWKANFLMVPERGFGFVVLSNMDGGRARARVMKAIRDGILDSRGN
jgi:CubicO group peptidase (beta-lactamase class C family)